MRSSLLSIFFPVLETFISSSLIKIVCKCNQIRGNESPADFTRVSRKVGFLLSLLLEFYHWKILEKVVYFFLRAPVSKDQKLGGLKQQKLFTIS